MKFIGALKAARLAVRETCADAIPTNAVESIITLRTMTASCFMVLLLSTGFCLESITGLDSGPAPAQDPEAPEKDHRPDEGYHDRAEVEPGDAGVPEVVEDPPAHERADDADDEIPEEAMGALSAHTLRQIPGDNADDNQDPEHTHLTHLPHSI